MRLLYPLPREYRKGARISLPKLLTLSLVVFITLGCSTGRMKEEPGSTRANPTTATEQGHAADAVRLSSFAGERPNFAVLVRWEEYGSARIRGEMRMTKIVDHGGKDPKSCRLDAYRSRFEGTRSANTVILHLTPRKSGGPSGTWVGELVKVPEDVDAPEELALRLRDPDGDRVLLSKGTNQNYADAVAKLAEDCCEGTSGRSC